MFRRTRATIKPVHPATVAIRPSVSNVRHVNRSSKLFNCERNEPVCTVIKVYGAIPKSIEKKKIFFGTFNNGHVIVISAFGLIGTIRMNNITKKRLSRPASTFFCNKRIFFMTTLNN